MRLHDTKFVHSSFQSQWWWCLSVGKSWVQTQENQVSQGISITTLYYCPALVKCPPRPSGWRCCSLFAFSEVGLLEKAASSAWLSPLAGEALPWKAPAALPGHRWNRQWAWCQDRFVFQFSSDNPADSGFLPWTAHLLQDWYCSWSCSWEGDQVLMAPGWHGAGQAAAKALCRAGPLGWSLRKKNNQTNPQYFI